MQFRTQPIRTNRASSQRPHPQKGVTLIEWVVAISILAIIAGSLVPRVTNHMAEARDARRMSDVRLLRDAIERFRIGEHRYPDAHGNAGFGGFDVSCDGEFIPELVRRGYLHEPVRDPGDSAACYYAYFLYDRGATSCASEEKFFVLAVKSFETAAFAARNRGRFACPDRDWSREFAFVTGGGLVTE